MTRIVIIGAGPTGLGAGWRLAEAGHREWSLLESDTHGGGLATSFLDDRGFTWDIGGHVQFSHYEYFDDVMDTLLGKDGWLHHERESWVWIRDRFIPYPFQNNLHRLPLEDLDACLSGLVDVVTRPPPAIENFRDWIEATAGAGIADVFLTPYNYKVWGYPTELMSAAWVGERVAVPDLKRILQNLIRKRDDVSWGPNNTFRFPKHGGTGSIWNACVGRLPEENLRLGDPVVSIDVERRQVVTASGRVTEYEVLMPTVPLRELLSLTGERQFDEVVERGLKHSSTNIFGIGLRGQPPEHLRTKCWMYFPEENCPFYRVTVFSNYSPHNVPEDEPHWSLMAEVSESPMKPVDAAALPGQVIEGLLATGLIERREDIVSRWQHRVGYGYPTPGIDRDEALAAIIPWFETRHIYPRGRFGLWKYEVSNQDHSFMQGVEWVERVLNGRSEITAFDPNHANGKKHPWPFERWAAQGAS